VKLEETNHIVEKEFRKWQSKSCDSVEALNIGSGSNRQYFRVRSAHLFYIATINDDLRENEAFYYLASFFKEKDIRVPNVEYISSDRRLYFQQDLGDENLLQTLKSQGCTQAVIGYYKESLNMLWKMQYAGQEVDYSHSYPRPSFDQQSVLWDLNYFKYYFLKVSGLTFDEQLLENDIISLSNDVAVGDDSYFMFRDFQARNIQIYDAKPWFIDFQGGRRGPLLYDVASLLYQASANLSNQNRSLLLEHYYKIISQTIDYPEKAFKDDFKMMVFIRIVQTLGAYGFRGLIEGKEYFKASIPNALSNLKVLLSDLEDVNKYPYFFSLLHQLVEIKDNFATNKK